MSARVAVLAVVAATLYAALLGVLTWLPRYDCLVLPVLVVGMFRALDLATPRDRAIALHAATQILLASFFMNLWIVGYEGRNSVLGGILPWSDSFDYVDDALRFAHGDRFTEFASKRPIFGALLAGMLRLTRGDLRFALVVCSIAGAWAITVAALEVWRTHGARAALVVYAILLLFERRWTGFVQTEHVGITLGAVGFALLWRANARRDAPGEAPAARRLALAGLFSIATALMARAGAFFVLPALAIWATRRLVPAEDGRLARLRYLALTGVALFAALAVHEATLLTAGRGVTFSDYPGIVYGLLHGEDYTYLAQTHPALLGLDVSQRVPASWNIVLAESRAHPLLVVSGLFKSGAGLFVSPFGMASYVWTNPDDHVLENAAAVHASMDAHGLLGPLYLWKDTLGLYSLLSAGAMALLAIAFVLGTTWSIARLFVGAMRRRPELSLLRHAIVGVLVSAPFTPPWITSGQQVQTASLAFVAAIPAVVLLGRAARGEREREGDPLPARDRLAAAPLVFAALLAASIAFVRLAPLPKPACVSDVGPGARAELLALYPSTEVLVTEARTGFLRDKAIGDLRYALPLLGKHNPDYAESVFPYVEPGARFVAAYDACDARGKIVIDDRRLLDDALSREAIRRERGHERFFAIEATPMASPRILRVQARPVDP